MAAHGELLPEPQLGIDPSTGALSKHIENYIQGFGHPNIVLVLGRSKTQNVVVYEALMDRGPGNLADDKPIEAYWLHIDPVCLEQERAKGHAEPREELGMIESVSFGVNFLKSKAIGDGSYSITLAPIPDRDFRLLVVDGRPRLETTIAGKPAYISRAYMEIEDFLVVATRTLWVDIYGYSVMTGELLHERIAP